MASNKEFNRDVCFTFYNGWAEQAKKMRVLYKDEVTLNYLFAIIDYALYQTEPSDPMIDMLLSPIKYQIDESQNRRLNGFSKENTEQTDKILQYKKEHPEASQDDIAKALGISKGKVNKVLQSNNVNNNKNNNTNNNSNINSVTVTVTDTNTYVQLTTEEKKRLREDIINGMSADELMQKYNCHPNYIQKIMEDSSVKAEQKRVKDQENSRIRMERISALNKHCSSKEDFIELSKVPNSIIDNINQIFADNHMAVNWDSCRQAWKAYDENSGCEIHYDDFLKYIPRVIADPSAYDYVDRDWSEEFFGDI